MKKKILIIDDSNDIANAMAEIVGMQGYDASVARSGADAMATLKNARQDLIILDLRLPDMDGLEVARHIRSNNETARLPILVVSSYAHGREPEIIAAGCSEVMDKSKFVATYPDVLKFYLGDTPQFPTPH
ncbi:MAG: response regulator [Acidobacteria bacterium]|nr:response regulator [Acidobacteriota bacterium]